MATNVKLSSSPKPLRKAPKKSFYVWEYKHPDQQGVEKKGEIEAVSLATAKTALRRSGMDVRYLKLTRQNNSLFGNSIKPAEIVAFLQQLSTLQNAGVAMMDALRMLHLTTKKPAMQRMVQRMIQCLQEGNQLSDALALFPKYFDHVSVSLVRAGEQGGVLDTVLKTIADYKQKDYSTRKKIRSALIYPGITISVMIVVVIIMMTTVIPVFAHLFKSFNAQLPELTLMVVHLSHWMTSHVLVLVFVPILTITLLIWGYRHSAKVRWNVDRVTLHIPVIGRLLLYGATARFMHTLALLYAAGVPIQEAMQTLSNVSGNTVIDQGVVKARQNVLSGGGIADGLKATKLPDLSVRMLAIGESSGNIEVMAQKTGDHYEGEVDEMVARMSTLLEPFIMIALGIIVGTLVIAMFLPMLDMGKAILHGSGA